MTNTILPKLAIAIAAAFMNLVAIEANPVQAEKPSVPENQLTARTTNADRPSSQENLDSRLAQSTDSYQIIPCYQVPAIRFGLPANSSVVVTTVGYSGSLPFVPPAGYAYYTVGGGGIREEVRLCQQLVQ